MSKDNPNRRDALRTVAALALTTTAAAAPVASSRPAEKPPAPPVDDSDLWDDDDGPYVALPGGVLMRPEHMDPDIVAAVFREQQQLAPEMVLLRARQEWDRLRKDGAGPRLVTDEHGETHWAVSSLTGKWEECAACGLDITSPDGSRIGCGQPGCLECRQLLRMMARGDAVRKSLRRAARS